jgi:hypothetical protein
VQNQLSMLLLGLALSLAPGTPASAQASGPVTPCAASGVSTVDSTWRQVRGSGFTFCVPGSWRARGHGRGDADAKDWTGEEGTITWGMGSPPSAMPDQEYEVTGTVTQLSPGEPMPLPPPTNESLQVSSHSPPCSQPTTSPRLVGGVVVFVTRVSCAGTWITTAWSANPRIYVRGQAHSEKAAALEVVVMQTVEFSAPTH